MSTTYHLIGPFKQLVSMANLPLKGALKDQELPIVENAGILIANDTIERIADFDVLVESAKDLQPKITELKGDFIALPGFIDSHTHICFGGSRAKDYAMRNAGKTYLEIAKSGGGIWDTVTQTRKASAEELVDGIIQRADRHLSKGITTIEVKSGYGLSVEEELKMLRAIKTANQTLDVDLIATCLAAHILPKDFDGDHKAYLEHIATELFPILQEEKLTTRIDAFVEEEAFSSEITLPYFEKAKALGFDITIHADQFSTGGSEVAVKAKAISADHLEASTDKEVALLANSDVIATALPGASLGLGCDFTPARKLLDAGAAVAIASDWNPGSGPMGDLLTQAAILGSFQKLANAEILAGITFRAAAALKLDNCGQLAPNFLADVAIFKTDDYSEILYHQGQITPEMVIKKGKLAYSKNS